MVISQSKEQDRDTARTLESSVLARNAKQRVTPGLATAVRRIEELSGANEGITLISSRSRGSTPSVVIVCVKGQGA